MSQQELLIRVAATLNQLGVEYLVTGSVASSFHGEPRATHDADLVIALSRDSVERLVASFPESEFYLSNAAIQEAIALGGMFNILSVESGDKIDCWMLTNTGFDQSRFARRMSVSMFGSTLSIQSVEDTIVSKLIWAKESGGSEKQLSDVRSILELRSGDLDLAYILQWVKLLNLDALWKQCQSKLSTAIAIVLSVNHSALVTGGSGFLGSHLCDRLMESGARVVCVDNFFTGVRANVEHLLNRPEFTLIEHDVVEPLDPQRVGPIDRIYNLACPASPPHYQYDPVSTMKTSVLGALNMLELAHLTGARILQASTSEVYGDPEEHPQRESYRGCVNPIGPRACYDEGKRAAETLFFDYRRTRGVDIRVARIFNTYGPRMHPFDGRVVSNFIRQALVGEDLTIYGDGEQTRSFCYVDDLVDGLMSLMEDGDDSPGPVNLGNPGEFTIRELADQVLKLTGANSKIVTRPLPVDDPKQRRPDIALAGNRLGWRPTIELAEGLEKTIAWFRSIDVSGYSPPTPAG